MCNAGLSEQQALQVLKSASPVLAVLLRTLQKGCPPTTKPGDAEDAVSAVFLVSVAVDSLWLDSSDQRKAVVQQTGGSGAAADPGLTSWSCC